MSHDFCNYYISPLQIFQPNSPKIHDPRLNKPTLSFNTRLHTNTTTRTQTSTPRHPSALCFPTFINPGDFAQSQLLNPIDQPLTCVWLSEAKVIYDAKFKRNITAIH